MVNADDVRTILREIVDPEMNVSIVDQGGIKDIKIEQGVITVKLASNYAGTPLAEYLTDMIRQKIEVLPEVDKVEVVIAGPGE
jgi:metal-sulfur cluster biosynthetic enzyme